MFFIVSSQKFIDSVAVIFLDIANINYFNSAIQFVLTIRKSCVNNIKIFQYKRNNNNSTFRVLCQNTIPSIIIDIEMKCDTVINFMYPFVLKSE